MGELYLALYRLEGAKNEAFVHPILQSNTGLMKNII